MLDISSTYGLVLLIPKLQETFVESLHIPGTMKDTRGVKYMIHETWALSCRVYSQMGMKDT